MRIKTLLLSLLLAGPIAAQLEPETFEAIRREGLERSQVAEFLDELTNGIGHRLTGSDNFTLACRWAVGELEALGFDEVQLEKWATWPLVWNRGQWTGRVLEPEAIELQVAVEAWTNGTGGRRRGRVLAMPHDEAGLDAVVDQLDGAWLLGPLPQSGTALRQLLDSVLPTVEIAGLLYPSKGDRKYPDRMRVFGGRPRSSEIPDGPPRIMIRSDQFERLQALAVAEAEVVAEFDIRNRWRDEAIDLHNVIAEIPGSELPQEVVVVCAHLDSWHQATGTTDNGTGVATTLEAARILMAVGANPKRTIRFCLWGGEEQGLIGSNRHVTMRRRQMPQVSAVFNHDSGTNWAQALRVTEAQAVQLGPLAAQVAKLPVPDRGDFAGPSFELQVVETLRPGGGSDHASFLAAGVPGLSWRLRGEADYGFSWHSQWDTYDVAIPEYQRHTAIVVALMALGTADLPELLSRDGVQRARGNDLQIQVEAIFGCDLGGKRGLVVKSVKQDGRGARIGLRSGDRLAALGEDQLRGLADLRRGMRRRSGDEDGGATLTVERDGAMVELVLWPEARATGSK